MEIRLNGQPFEFDVDSLQGAVPTVAALLVVLDLQGKRVAVEVNGELVPRSGQARHALVEGDRIEVVEAIGGG
jgi:sulfur carrier protein